MESSGTAGEPGQPPALKANRQLAVRRREGQDAFLPICILDVLVETSITKRLSDQASRPETVVSRVKAGFSCQAPPMLVMGHP